MQINSLYRIYQHKHFSKSLSYRPIDDAPSNPKNKAPLKIGAFNIQIFGDKKMSIQAVKDILVKVGNPQVNQLIINLSS